MVGRDVLLRVEKEKGRPGEPVGWTTSTRATSAGSRR